MYCVKCGVKLADTEKSCPLCQTRVYHPELRQPETDSLYPKNKYPAVQPRSLLPQMIVTVLTLVAISTVLMCDLQLTGTVTWSGYVVGALVLFYSIFVLPYWFRNPNPVIFVPCGFSVLEGYLLYIDLTLSGGWFLSFAFPVAGGIGLIVTAVVTLLRYVKGGKLYIFGGAFLTLGGFLLLMEFLMNLTFDIPGFKGWSLYPLIAMAALGGTLIFLAICAPARQTMERKLFF